jgi:hypothetical protein
MYYAQGNRVRRNTMADEKELEKNLPLEDEGKEEAK